MLHKLQYISQGETADSHLQNIEKVLDAGVKLVQLRLKNCDENIYMDYAHKAKELCLSYEAILIINDNPLVAKNCNADAVHLGLGDMSVSEAKKIVPEKLIGGTANTWEHIRQRSSEGVDYIGLGPFRFTKTKENLQPILGLEGYKRIINQMKTENFDIPVFAIGGIELKDVESIIKTGVYGIAVSGMLTHGDNKNKLVKELNKILYDA